MRSLFGNLLHRFHMDRRGAIAMIFAVAIAPIMLLIGVAVDFAQVSKAQAAAQAALDSAALVAARSGVTDPVQLKALAAKYLQANTSTNVTKSLDIQTFTFDATTGEVSIKGGGTVQTSFLVLAGYSSLSFVVNSSALREVSGAVELALVLDNTWSMSETAGSGQTKIQALKTAATNLVNTLMRDSRADVKIALVPFADYVNVGVANRNMSWLSVPADYSTTTPRTCTTQTTRTTCEPRTCVRGTPKTCTSVTDGVTSTYDCTPNICTPATQVCTTTTVAPYEVCSGGSTTNYKWYGCVGSRTSANLWRSDASPSVPYPGFLATSQNCLNPILTLTSNKASLLTAINNLVINVGSYKPATYIPGGLIWGVNTLSPTEPFAEGRAYDPANRRPRKALVLMTDGANTLRMDQSTGRHVAFNGSATNQQSQLGQSNADTAAICTYAKSQGIEVFTIAFAVTDTTAKTMLQNCASSAANYFDATSSSALIAAFDNIAIVLNQLRLSR
ncbi:pilus assembly protein TadG-related protein [Phreatobacter aquaticus]|nr:pilus assembly protein TadG-related protein [Phreatobacter aquaticus]